MGHSAVEAGVRALARDVLVATENEVCHPFPAMTPAAIVDVQSMRAWERDTTTSADPGARRPSVARLLRRRLSYANVVASLALLAALGGTSYAAFKLAPASVGNRELRDGAVTSSKVKNGSLLARDFKPGQLRGAKGTQGAPGGTGQQGLKGDPGSSGHDGVPGLGASGFSDDRGLTPPGPTSSTIKQITISTSQPGKLVVLDAAVESASVTNTTDVPLTFDSGVYVDGIGVPGTYSTSPGSVPPQSSAALTPFTLPRGSISNVPAGTHTVTLALRQPSGSTVNYVTGATGRVLVIATP